MECDKCGANTFYDEELNYDYSKGTAKVRGRTYSLDNCGDIVCLCIECAKMFQCIIIPIQENSLKGILK